MTQKSLNLESPCNGMVTLCQLTQASLSYITCRSLCFKLNHFSALKA